MKRVFEIFSFTLSFFKCTSGEGIYLELFFPLQWSYGVTCCEVFTCGRVPYTGVPAMTLLISTIPSYCLASKINRMNVGSETIQFTQKEEGRVGVINKIGKWCKNPQTRSERLWSVETPSLSHHFKTCASHIILVQFLKGG